MRTADLESILLHPLYLFHIFQFLPDESKNFLEVKFLNPFEFEFYIQPSEVLLSMIQSFFFNVTNLFLLFSQEFLFENDFRPLLEGSIFHGIILLVLTP